MDHTIPTSNRDFFLLKRKKRGKKKIKPGDFVFAGSLVTSVSNMGFKVSE